MSVVFERPKQSSPRLELTPLIDVIFQLLIFFMISSSFLYPSLDISLPKLEKEQASNNTQRLVVSIDNNGLFFINNHPIDKDSLESAISEGFTNSGQKSVFFRADKKIAYQQVLDVMQIANQAGAEHFNFIYENAS